MILGMIVGTVVSERRGDLQGALKRYREALKHHAGEAMVHNNLANALYQQNRGPEAESACRLALRIDPDLAEFPLEILAVLRGQGLEFILELGQSLSRLATEIVIDRFRE